MSRLTDKYLAQIIEEKWRKNWQKPLITINNNTQLLEKNKSIYSFNDDLPKNKTFVIDTPPPTVSGLLHMGHIFSYTQADFVARFRRMQGFDVFYPMGFDDNGLPTERLVEKIIGKKAMVFEKEMQEKNGGGSGYFVKKCREVVVEAEEEFEELFKEIALSVDWEQKYQTISPESQKISQASFIDLFNKGLVEKKLARTFFDIVDQTALAKADLIDKEIEGEMHFIEFGVESENSQARSQNFVIMTTRPELLGACVAVMISSKDSSNFLTSTQKLNENGEGFTGSYAITPLFGVKVPIIIDNLVQEGKGTEKVMCCTWGDETDMQWQDKHQLPTRQIISEDGLIIKLIDENKDYNSFDFHDEDIFIEKNFEIGMNDIINFNDFLKIFQKISKQKIKEAGKIIIENLKLQNFYKNSEKNIRAVKCAERSGVPIEIIRTSQWFIKILPFKEKLIEQANKCNWYPQYMRIRIEQWIDGLSWDWCISRQRFFGVKFPVWYSKRKGEEGKILVASLNQLPCDPFIDLPEGYQRDEVISETDIMDTWATSSITPQLSSKGISNEIDFGEKNKSRHQKLFPADMRPQAHEIIRTWALYTIVKAYLHSLDRVKNIDGTFAKNADGSTKLQENINSNSDHDISIPWKNLMISGWCLASDKTKMSKSKGNVVTPKALIQEKSADVVRYWASASSLGADIAYSEEVFKIGQKLITKIFNCAKFCSQHFNILDEYFLKNPNIKNNDEALINLVFHSSDLWILSKLEKVIQHYNSQFENFEYAKAREILEEFFWKDFCDNYLEICKVRSYGLNAEKLANINLSTKEKEIILQKQLSSIATLCLVLKNILKLFAPFLVHITEEIYASIFEVEFEEKKSIHARGNYAKLSLSKNQYFSKIDVLKIEKNLSEIIFLVRKFKSENNLSMKAIISLLEIPESYDIEGLEDDFLNVCNVLNISKKPQIAIINIVL